MKSKKFLISVIIILVVIISGSLGYIFIAKAQTSAATTSQNPAPGITVQSLSVKTVNGVQITKKLVTPVNHNFKTFDVDAKVIQEPYGYNDGPIIRLFVKNNENRVVKINGDEHNTNCLFIVIISQNTNGNIKRESLSFRLESEMSSFEDLYFQNEKIRDITILYGVGY
jgi:hypothetical protein